MTPEQWQKIRPILESALELAPVARPAFLDGACPDAALRREVESLIATPGVRTSFLESPAVAQVVPIERTSSVSIWTAGMKVGPYEIKSLLGAGGMGEVYRARDTRLDRTVAIKVLPRHLSSDPARKQRLEREARAIAALQHANICTLFDVGHQDGTDYLVMEYLEGETLSARLSNGPLPLDYTLRYGIEMADALESAHRAGIVHRDLKPGNIMVTVHGECKVLDFGLAKLGEEKPSSEPAVTRHEALTSPGQALGTVAYMSPEQARGEPLDSRTDIFSLGAVLYEMATGKMAFAGKTSAVIFKAILGESPPAPTQLNPKLPERMDEIVGKTLEKDRELRYQSAADLRADLKLLKRDTDLESVHPGVTTSRRKPGRLSSAKDPTGNLLERLARWPLRRKIPAAAGVGLLLLFLGGLLWQGSRRVPAVTAHESIMIGNFLNTTAEDGFDSILEQGLAVQLEQSPFLEIVSDQQIQAILSQMGQSGSARLIGKLAQEVCQRLNATVMLAGSIATLGHRYVVSLNAINCGTGDTLAREQNFSEGKEHILETIGKAAALIRYKLGESSGSIAEFNTPLEQATTPSLDALKAFSLGIDLHDRKGDYSGSIPFFRRALELDSDFALAHLALAKAYINVGKLDLALQSFQDAYNHRDRASDREKWNIISAYHGYLTGDLEKAIQESEAWAKAYPLDRDPHFQLYIAYSYLGNWEKALAESQEILRLEPRSAIDYGNLVAAYTNLDRLDEAKATSELAWKKGLDSDILRVNLYQLAFVQNDAAGMAQQADWAAGNRALGHLILSSEADTAAYFGKLRKARELSRRAVALATSEHDEDLAAAWQADASLREALFGNAEQARLASAAAASGALKEVRAAAGLSMAFGGETERAQVAAVYMAKHFPEDTLVNLVYLPVIRARIELNRNNPAKALELLQAVAPYELGSPNYIWLNPYAMFVRGEAYLAMRQGQAAQDQFQNILAHRGVVQNLPIGALAHLGLGRSYGIQGNTAKARAAYQDFFALWKDADSDIPVLKQAQLEYAKLR